MRFAGLPTISNATTFHPTRWWRCVLSDGTVWAESSDEEEIRAKCAQVVTGGRVTYSGAGCKSYGPDPDAKVEHLYERSAYEWRQE